MAVVLEGAGPPIELLGVPFPWSLENPSCPQGSASTFSVQGEGGDDHPHWVRAHSLVLNRAKAGTISINNQEVATGHQSGAGKVLDSMTCVANGTHGVGMVSPY
jgi:hypothetical protein